LADGINAARTVFPNCYFDREKCADGLQSLRHYRYDVDPDTGQFSRTPLHDQYSHAADALRYMALSTQSKKPVKKDEDLRYQRSGAGWMSA
jgi:phage terminase large subunit